MSSTRTRYDLSMIINNLNDLSVSSAFYIKQCMINEVVLMAEAIIRNAWVSDVLVISEPVAALVEFLLRLVLNLEVGLPQGRGLFGVFLLHLHN